jgi:Ni,Fe-hydrogenase I large subunit
MRIITSLLLLAAGSVSAVTYDFSDTLKKIANFYVSEASRSWTLYEGTVLGLQQNPTNEKHQCYVSFGTLKSDIQKMPGYIKAISNSSSSDNSAITAFTTYAWYQPGTYFKLIKRGQELGALFFDLYE